MIGCDQHKINKFEFELAYLQIANSIYIIADKINRWRLSLFLFCLFNDAPQRVRGRDR